MKSLWIRRVFGLMLLLVLASFLFAVTTETGLRCLIRAGNRLTGGLLTIGSASGALLGETIRLADIRYADGVDTVTIAAVELAWEPARLLDGEVRVRSIRGTEVRILLGKGSGETALIPFSLPIDLAVDDAAADSVAIFSGQDEIWTIVRGTGSGLSYRQAAIRADKLSLPSEAFTVQGGGEMRTDGAYPLRVAAEFRSHPDGYEPIAVQGAITGTLNGLLVEADAQAPFPAHLSGRLDRLLADTAWQAQVTAPEAVLSAINRDWPEQRFARVTVDGRGTFSDYALHVQSQAGLPTLTTASALAADLKGDGSGLTIDNLQLDHGPARLAAKGSLTWSPHFSWQAEANGSRLNPGLFLADWPGDFTGSLTTSGQTTDQGLQASCIVPAVRGTLRGFPLTGNGELSIAGSRIDLPRLNIKSGNSELRASGRIDKTVEIEARLDSNNLAELWPGAQGTVKAQGRVVGSREKPQIEARVNGDHLALSGYGLQTLQVEAKGVAAPNGSVEIAAQAGRLRLGAEVVDAARLQLKGSMQDHTLEASAESRDFSAGLSLQGSLRSNRWQATLGRSHFSSREHGDWRQQQPAALTFAADGAEIKPWCLQSASIGGLCVDGSWQPSTGVWRARGTAAALSLEALTASRMSRPLTGRLQAEIDLTGQQARLLTGKLSASADGMQLRILTPDGATHQVAWQKNALTARYADNRLQTALESELTDHSTLQAELTATGDPFAPATFLRSPVSGSLRLNLLDLRPVATLTGQMVHLTGTLRGQLAVNGTPASPVVNGQLDLTGGQAEIPPLGITLSPLQLKLASDGRSARLVADARSGEGTLRAESVLHLDRLTTEAHSVHFSGDKFKAARLPGLDLDVSPDLTLLFGPQKVAVRGTVAIPSAKITSIDFHQAAIASDDMVVIDEDDAAANTAAMPLFTDITVIAGDDVQIDAYGLKCAIDGRLTVNGQPGRPQTGRGTLSVRNGSFTIYGRRLNIDLGRLHFSGGPLTNPGIELRSERKNDKVTTGVLVSGFLQKPEMHFYSSPVLEQSAIITHLLASTAIGGETRQDTGFLGTAASKVGLGGMVPYLQGLKQLTMIDEIRLDAGNESDSLSLVLGSWLTPYFYVSYGKDLVKESGSFNTRYTLGKGFSFLTETGAAHSGGDIKYEFER